MVYKLSCHNRKPYVDFFEVGLAWTQEGARVVLTQKNVMSKSCQFDLRLREAGCQGCKWQVDSDPRDGTGVWRVPALPVIEPAKKEIQ